MKFLGANAEEISSFRRLGKFNATNKRPRQFLAKFRNVITADRLFARVSMLKNYELNIKGLNVYEINTKQNRRIKGTMLQCKKFIQT